MSIAILALLGLHVGSGCSIKVTGEAVVARRATLLIGLAHIVTALALVFALLVLERGWP